MKTRQVMEANNLPGTTLYANKFGGPFMITRNEQGKKMIMRRIDI
ncbi:hypothetical protein DYY66_1261 [Candidatus Nitrosotalea sp. FS]|nr:hypothetical protein [Candidatus Nitrosotalea sp. FS]